MLNNCRSNTKIVTLCQFERRTLSSNLGSSAGISRQCLAEAAKVVRGQVLTWNVEMNSIGNQLRRTVVVLECALLARDVWNRFGGALGIVLGRWLLFHSLGCVEWVLIVDWVHHPFEVAGLLVLGLFLSGSSQLNQRLVSASTCYFLDVLIFLFFFCHVELGWKRGTQQLLYFCRSLLSFVISISGTHFVDHEPVRGKGWLDQVLDSKQVGHLIVGWLIAQLVDLQLDQGVLVRIQGCQKQARGCLGYLFLLSYRMCRVSGRAVRIW